MTPPDLQSYFDEIFDAIKHANFDSNIEIICEPGRALVAESTSLIVRVEARKENMLYLNDGTYGGLFDAGSLGFIYPTKAYKINENHNFDEKLEPFGFFGPTCDSIDTMKGPFYLPKDIDEGDYIEIGQMGAYSRSIRTKFNGFENSLLTEISDEPLVSLFANEPTQNKKHFFKKNK
jgi:ornithine decarboxylase